MFTGIIEEMGSIISVKKGANSAILNIGAQKVLEDAKIGDSIAVNGVCLTVTAFSADSFTVDVMHETINCSSLAGAKGGMPVNLERAMPSGGRFGGHIVAGHVDGVGTIENVKKDDNAILFTISAKPQILRYIVAKGSIAIDGISLTVAAVTDSDFTISLIPHTAKMTTLGSKKPGDPVNLENDMIGKYVEKLLLPYKGQGEAESSSITREFLLKNGF